jgi:hypothetical protein
MIERYLHAGRSYKFSPVTVKFLTHHHLLDEGLTPDVVAWVCIGVYPILNGNINYTVDMMGAVKDDN